MKINNQINVHNVLKTYQKNAKVENVNSKKALELDKVEISNAARDMQLAMKALSELPEVRRDKVETIKSEMASGTYKADAGDIVDKLFSEVLGARA